MSKKQMSRRALFASVISLILCCAMLMGITFAWFTDSVTSGVNKIEAGNLDIELLVNGDDGYTAIDTENSLFTADLWEPGHVEMVNLQISNLGTLALKYQFRVYAVSETKGINAAGESFRLSDYIQYAIIPSEFTGDRAAAVAEAEKNSPSLISSMNLKAEGTMKAGEQDIPVTLVVWMPETVGNEANHKTDTTAPTITLGIELLATQLMNESDSFGTDYDEEAGYPALGITSMDELRAAAVEGGTYALSNSFQLDEPLVVSENFQLIGNGNTLSRTAGFTGNLITVKTGANLTLKDIIVDGGAVWSDNQSANSTNTGATATGYLIATEGNGSIILEKDAVLQNNDGNSAVGLATRGGGSLTVNGAQIINNRAAGGGAIWGGGNITVNEGSKINGNHATSIGGAIRMVDGYNNITFTMNGGEMNHNSSASTGGAIWGGNRASYYFNGGEMAYNSAASAGGAIWTGAYENYYFSGDFKLHNNSAGELGGAIRFSDHASLTMTGGSVYDNTVNGSSSAFYLNNNSATITGGSISDNFSYSGGLGLTMGNVDMDGVVSYNLSTNHNTAYLAAEFNGFSFTVNESDTDFANFNFKPADGYTYSDGDEAKLVCENPGYEVYWDATTSTFRLQAK